MAKSKLSLENSSLTWSDKRRYKVNAIVTHLGNIYQNLTGKNSEPGVGNDWYLGTIADVSEKEDKTNKQNSLDPDGSGNKYVTVDAINGAGFITIKGEYESNDDAIANGLVAGDVYSLPYLYPNGVYPLAVVGAVVINEWMKSITVNSTSVQTDFPIYLTVYNTVGTDSGSSIYLNGKVRSDWGDVRFFNNTGTSIPFGIVEKQSTYIKVVFSGNFTIGSNIFYIKYNKPAVSGDITKFGITTDQHYDSAEPYVGRNQTLTRLDNFSARMMIYQPNCILEGGDKVGSVTTNAATRLSFMQSVTNKHSALATALGVSNYLWGWGNHDFELNSFTSVQSQYNGLIGQVSGNLYATWSDANYTYISLDANYTPSTDTHLSNAHNGFGYVNPAQLTWLASTLSAATKPCIILCHQLLAEADTERWLLTKEIYHVQNRVAVRTILEASGKVLFVLCGHCHNTSHNIIKGIPYLSLVDINEPSSATQHWDTPFVNLNGRWGTIEIDRSTLSIRFRQEVQILTTVSTVYDFSIPYKTIYDSNYGDNLEKVFSLNNTGLYGKAAIVSDASDLYVNDDLYVLAKPASIYDNDPMLSDKSIKIYGITNAPNYGRVRFDFTSQTGIFKCTFSCNLSTLSTKNFRLQITGTSTIGPYVSFNNAGVVGALNGVTATNISTYVINTWYKIEIYANVSTKKYDVYINGALVANQFDFNSASATSISQLELVTETGNMILDSFRIEKSTTTIPNITAIGSEEISF